MIITFVLSNRTNAIMKKPTKEQKVLEDELIYYLRLFNELKNRDRARDVTRFVEEKIDELVELLKLM